MSKYSLIEADDDVAWDEFVEASPQGTIFSTSLYLSATSLNFRRYFVFKGPYETKAAIAVLESEDLAQVRLDDLVIYNGIMFSHDAHQKTTAARFERIEITEFAIGVLLAKYSSLALALSPHFEDLRPFLWHSSGDGEARRHFSVRIRYTSYLDITEFAAQSEDIEMSMFKTLERQRRRHIKEFLASGMKSQIGCNVHDLIKNYRSTLASQGVEPPQGKLQKMSSLVSRLIEENKAFLLNVVDGSAVLYSIVCCVDSKRAYALFAAGHPDLNIQLGGTVAYWEAFKHLARAFGINEIDLEGINSPRGGAFKLGFGGDIRAYYELRI
jgi:hypothetical protein